MILNFIIIIFVFFHKIIDFLAREQAMLGDGIYLNILISKN